MEDSSYPQITDTINDSKSQPIHVNWICFASGILFDPRREATSHLWHSLSLKCTLIKLRSQVAIKRFRHTQVSCSCLFFVRKQVWSKFNFDQIWKREQCQLGHPPMVDSSAAVAFFFFFSCWTFTLPPPASAFWSRTSRWYYHHKPYGHNLDDNDDDD